MPTISPWHAGSGFWGVFTFLCGRRLSAEASPSYLQLIQKSHVQPAALPFGLALVTGFPLSLWAMHGAQLPRDIPHLLARRAPAPRASPEAQTPTALPEPEPPGRSRQVFKPSHPETGRCQQNSCSHQYLHRYHTTSPWGCCEIQLSHPTWPEISQPSGCRNSLGG